MKIKFNALSNKIINQIVLLLLYFIIIIALNKFANGAFVSISNKFDSTDTYMLSNGEKVCQIINNENGLLKGITIRIGTYDRINSGRLIVEFCEQGELKQTWDLAVENIVDNSYHECLFDDPIMMSEEKQYSISLVEYCTESNELALYTSSGGQCLYTGIELIADRTLCYQLIKENKEQGRKLFIYLFIFSIIVFCIIFYKIDFEKFNRNRAIFICVFIVLVLYTVSFDLFPMIKTDILVGEIEGSQHELVLGANISKTFSFEAERDTFTSLEFFLSGDNRNNIQISLFNETYNICYFDSYKIKDENIIIDQDLGIIAVNVDIMQSYTGASFFQKGTYTITVTNIDSEKELIIGTKDEEDAVLNIVIRKHSWLGIKIACLIIIFLFSYLVIVYFINLEKKLNVINFFLISIFYLSIIYLILMQPWSAPDSIAHYLAAYRHSNILLGYTGSEEWSGRADDALYYSNLSGAGGINPNMQGIMVMLHNLRGRVSDNEMVNLPEHEERMEYYSIINYLPQALGLVIGRILGLGSVCTVYLARFFILAVYIYGCFRAIKTTPIGKSIFAMVALLPMSLMMSSAFSYDAMVIISSLNFIASVLCLYKEKYSKVLPVECMFWAFIIGAVKGGGYLVLLPTLIILYDKDNKHNIFKILSIVGSGLVSVVVFDLLIPAGSSLFQFGVSGNGKMSASFALEQPLEYLKMCITTYIEYADNLVLNMCGTQLSWLEYTLPSTLIVAIIIIWGINAINEKDEVVLSENNKYVFVFVTFIVILSTPIMLLSWTSIGSNTIKGIQGRYFLPVLPLVGIVLSKYKIYRLSISQGIKEERNLEQTCFKWLAILYVLTVYYLMKKYLTR